MSHKIPLLHNAYRRRRMIRFYGFSYLMREWRSKAIFVLVRYFHFKKGEISMFSAAICFALQSLMLSALREGRTSEVRIAILAIFQSWPEDEEADGLILQTRTELLQLAKAHFEKCGWEWSENDKHGLKLTDPNGTVYSATNPYSMS